MAGNMTAFLRCAKGNFKRDKIIIEEQGLSQGEAATRDYGTMGVRAGPGKPTRRLAWCILWAERDGTPPVFDCSTWNTRYRCLSGGGRVLGCRSTDV